MITKRDILKMVKAVHRHDRGLPSRRLIYPAREWGIGVVVAGLLLVAACGITASVYLSLNALQERVDVPTVQTVVYEQQTAERALELYTERAEQYAALTASAVRITPLATSSPATTTPTITESADETVTPEEPETEQIFVE